MQISAEKEIKASDRLFASLIRFIEERQSEVSTEIMEKKDAAERRAQELIDELQQEIVELQRRNTELEELRKTEDHLHLLQVTIFQLTSPTDMCEKSSFWLKSLAV